MTATTIHKAHEREYGWGFLAVTYTVVTETRGRRRDWKKRQTNTATCDNVSDEAKTSYVVISHPSSAEQLPGRVAQKPDQEGTRGRTPAEKTQQASPTTKASSVPGWDRSPV